MSTMIDDALQNISTLVGGPNSFPLGAEPLSQRVASALGWQRGSARLEERAIDNGRLNVAQGYLGPQKAAVFATNGGGSIQQFLPDAARFAYHSSVHWGLAADNEGLVVFNSHWIQGGDWFRLPEIQWSALDRHRDILAAITPTGVATGQLDQVAIRIQVPDRVLTPVDDALVARLGFWRLQALRYGDSSDKLDEDLHALFAQFFVIRTVEDRGLAPEIPRLASILHEQGVSFERLSQLFLSARNLIQAHLFEEKSFRRFPSFVLAGIVRDLYSPSELPKGSQQYNFAWIDSDVLGRAYEKYLANVYAPIPPSPQLSFLEQPLRDVQEINVKKAGGIFYTPSYLVGTLTEQSIKRTLEQQDDPDYIPLVADFACGSGPFLVEAFNVMLRHLNKRNPEGNWARRIIEERRIIGIDIDPRAVQLSRLNLWTRCAAEPHPLPLPSIDEIIVVGDALGEAIWANIPEKYDVIVGNPPFIATGGITSREELAKRFTTALGRYDYSHLFVELAVRKLVPGGTLGLVLPNRIYRNRDAGAVRQLLTEETDLLIILDFGSNEVFVGTSAYIGAVVARKKYTSVVHNNEATKVVLIADVSDTRYLGGILTNAIENPVDSHSEVLASFDTQQPSGEQPWLLISPSAREARMRLEQNTVLLGDFAGIFQGIRTGANDIFIASVESSDGVLVSVTTLLGEATVLDAALLHPVVFGSDIQRYDSITSNRVLLYPYRRGVVLSERELESEFPATYQYLSRNRNLLAKRGSIAASGLHWYELVRRRDESWLSSSKLLTRDLATRTSFALDSSGETFLVGGTAIVPPEQEFTLPLLAYLNSSTANDFLVELTPAFRGAFLKFEPQHLTKLPIPQFLIDYDDRAKRLGGLAKIIIRASISEQESIIRQTEAEIDQLVADAISYAL